MEIGVSSYSYSRLVNDKKMSQLEVISKAKEMGFDFIEFAGLSLPQGETPVTYAPRIKEECDKVGIKAVNYAVYADFLNGSGGDIKSEVARVKEELKAASIMGCSLLRHDATWGFPAEYKGKRGFDDALDKLAEGCRRVTEFAAELGIKTMVENHGYFCQDSDRIEKLVNAVNHPNFGVLLDMGNFLCVDEDSVKAVGKLAAYAFHVHMKDFHVKAGNLPNPGEGWFGTRGGNYLRGAIVGHGEVPVQQCLKLLKNSGYSGRAAIEFEGIEDPLVGIAIGRDNARRFVSEI